MALTPEQQDSVRVGDYLKVDAEAYYDVKGRSDPFFIGRVTYIYRNGYDGRDANIAFEAFYVSYSLQLHLEEDSEHLSFPTDAELLAARLMGEI